MTDMKHDDQEQDHSSREVTRRDFVAMSVAAGIAAAAGSASAQAAVVEKDVDIKMPDGTCNAVLIHPATGSYPGVLIWADAFGLRPGLREMGKRLAAEGYTVLVPNPFYRVARDPGLDPKVFDRAKITPLMASVNAPGNPEKDAVAYIQYLDAQPQVNKAKKIGTQGYCMGGPLVMRTAAVMPDRVGAGGSFHGGGLVAMRPDGTLNPESPHLLIPKMRARMLVAVAANDDKQQPDAKDKLREAFAAAKVPAEVEVFPAQHGWCMADTTVYSAAEAERAWQKLLALYKTALA
jgi:carboxymethylenebutenolidase